MISRGTVLVSLLCLAWILPGLVAHDPWKPDEAYTFGLIYSILQGGSWIEPTLAAEPFIEKPPLYYLTAAASALIFSPPLPLHDAARFATGFYIGLAFMFTGMAGRELFGRGHGTISVLLLLGCLGLAVRGHQLITDIALLAGFAMGFYGFALAQRRTALGGFWLGTGMGVGFMSKGLIAPGMLGLTALALVAFRSWRNRGYMLTLAAAAAAALPWLVIWPAALYRGSPQLFDEWLWMNNFGRFFGTASLGPAAETAHYLGILPWYAFPVLLLALWVLWAAREKGFTTPRLQLPFAGFAVIFLVLSAAFDARELYAMPLLIPLTLLATPAIDTLRRGASNAWYWFSVMGFTFFVVVAWFYWTGLELGLPARLHQHLHRLQPGYAPGLKPLPFTLGLAYTLAWFAVLLRLRRSPERPVIVWAAGVTTIWALLAILFIGWIDTGKSYRSMIVSMQQALPPQYRCVSSRDLGEPQRAMLHYFAGVITFREEVPGRRRDCDLLLTQGKPPEEKAPPAPWQKIWEGNRPGDNAERYRLYQKR